jgi:ABC-type multidrug transport system ATPase subunit
MHRRRREAGRPSAWNRHRHECFFTGGGLTSEQRKRLTIAVELVANPSVIFLDEPTSGLDARAALVVMRAVRSIVNTGRTVVCTIHQPNKEIFEAFDSVSAR